jgi:hypothetical protein
VRNQVCVGTKKNVVFIGVIDDHKPLAVRLVAKPVIYESEDISLWVIASGKFDFGSNVSIGLFESGSIARMHPKHPGLRRRVPDSVRVLDRNLGLPTRDVSPASRWDNVREC